ncbi:5-oxoprolinase subunit B family protein [Pseudaestuariivita atlantica]|uniref:Allophanate hydrolase n=1 Tax=Pseudaestuariivita atlantica TaxID=1317121 RepID=A0A0L1JMG0_9RHOB|nr:allophanate hydrolase subunit 1 [Pseudaestuariivita atlantica]KNG92929.1 allophanate hydrolase [Pseudaestuariivita atlantica]
MTWPQIRHAGYDGFVVTFGTRLSEPANRAALAFRDAIDHAGIDAVEESSTSLVSAYVRFDPLQRDHAAMRATLETLVQQHDWFAVGLPSGRRLWRVPTVFGGDAAPQLAEAASVAGLSERDAIASIAETQVRVQTIGFAPGMPYLGELPPAWDIPRQTELTARVPAGGLCVAIRQLVLFPVDTPTGWRHVGQTALRLFRPDAPEPFLLRPGDEVLFDPVSPEELDRVRDDANGGATCEDIA